MQSFSYKLIQFIMQAIYTYLHYLFWLHIQTSPWVTACKTLLEAWDPWNLVLSDPVNLTFNHALQGFQSIVNTIVEKSDRALSLPGQVKFCANVLQL